MFKRTCSVLTLILLTIWMSLSPAFAGAGIPVKGYGYSTGPEVSTAQVVKTSPGLIYDVSVNATSALAFMVIYDSSNGVSPNIIYECEAATAGNTTHENFSNPLATANGITISVTNGVGFLNYQ